MNLIGIGIVALIIFGGYAIIELKYHGPFYGWISGEAKRFDIELSAVICSMIILVTLVSLVLLISLSIYRIFLI